MVVVVVADAPYEAASAVVGKSEHPGWVAVLLHYSVRMNEVQLGRVQTTLVTNINYR